MDQIVALHQHDDVTFVYNLSTHNLVY